MTEEDRRAAAKVREFWDDYKIKNPGISQEAAAARAGFGQSAFSQFLLGRAPIRMSPAIKFAKLFGVPPTDIRPDLVDLPYAIEREASVQIAREPAPQLSAEAIEIARAFERLSPQTRERLREQIFILSVVDRSFPWLRTGKPISASYEKFEKNHEDNMRAQLTLEAARIAKLQNRS